MVLVPETMIDPSDPTQQQQQQWWWCRTTDDAAECSSQYHTIVHLDDPNDQSITFLQYVTSIGVVMVYTIVDLS